MSGNEFLTIYRNLFPLMKRHLDMLTLRHWDKKISLSKNILNKSGMKFYSQNDEDGILMEILNRINIKQGNFFEIGVCGGHKNNGTECNTIILLMLGWSGIWIDGVNIDGVKYFIPRANIFNSPVFINHWVWIKNQNIDPKTNLTGIKF